MTNRLIITARILPDGQPFKVIGRDAWALRNLVKAGETGCTPIDHPGPRWSAYVWKLRTKYGLVIETIEEKHEGQFSGSHARYVIHSEVAILAESDRMAA
ncbi:hypothetical protein DEM27_28600 [Metarhizobium album]|uniref:Winged helix domain-containing protein n=1 Tax=Metarhizobium album TaxID=2182425 RepID=A0A2U2DHM3_9HYPH|nr:hypothetical protein DEM27_28600 [Rhizobium album]